MQSKNSIQHYLADILPLIDEALSKEGMRVPERPMQAAREFVDGFVLEVSNDTKDDYLLKPWFASIYGEFVSWFVKRYGEAKVHPGQASSHGCIKHFGALFGVDIPLTLARPQPDGTCHFVFPKEVLPGEDPVLWLTSGPPLDGLKPKQLETLRATVSAISAQVRSIHNDLLTADVENELLRETKSSVMRHLSKAAEDMSSGDGEARSLAVWDMQMACEKVMKVRLAQLNIVFRHTHDLRELHGLAPRAADWAAVKKLVERFPKDASVIQWRHQEVPAPSIDEVWRLYQVALALCRAYAASLDRRLEMNNAVIHLRRPPWLGEVASKSERAEPGDDEESASENRGRA